MGREEGKDMRESSEEGEGERGKASGRIERGGRGEGKGKWENRDGGKGEGRGERGGGEGRETGQGRHERGRGGDRWRLVEWSIFKRGRKRGAQHDRHFRHLLFFSPQFLSKDVASYAHGDLLMTGCPLCAKRPRAVRSLAFQPAPRTPLSLPLSAATFGECK